MLQKCHEISLLTTHQNWKLRISLHTDTDTDAELIGPRQRGSIVHTIIVVYDRKPYPRSLAGKSTFSSIDFLSTTLGTTRFSYTGKTAVILKISLEKNSEVCKNLELEVGV